MNTNTEVKSLQDDAHYMTVACSYCGKEVRDYFHEEKDYVWIEDGTFACKECAEKLGLKPCVQCGKWCKPYRLNETHDGEYVCDLCLRTPSLYVKCAKCGEIFPRSEVTNFHNTFLCDECAEKEGMIRCDECGRYMPLEEATTVANGDTVCSECLDEYYAQCDECCEWYRKENMYSTPDGYVCEGCRDNCDYMYCEECDCYHPSTEMTRVRYRNYADDWEYVCDDCLNNGDFVKCDDCGEWVHREWAHRDDYDNVVCDYCYDNNNYYECAECGRLINEDEQYYDENTDAVYCVECYDELRDNEEYDYIHSYHHGAISGTVFHDTDAEPTYYGNIRYYGMELEVDDGDRSEAVEDVFYALNPNAYGVSDDTYAHFEEDGSLSSDGFELITQPMTRAYLETYRPRLEKAVEILSRAGFRSHDARMCGLHIHVSRNTLSSQTIDNMIYALSLFWHTCVRISRRTPYQLSSYAKSYAALDENEPGDTPDKVIERAKDAMRERSRYFALNTTNSDTIELRICRGTLNVDTIYASLDFYAALIKFAETHNETDMMKMSVDDFSAYLENYSDRLAAYMEKRGL